MKVELVLNGKPVKLDFEPQETLAEVLRNRCHLTGLKISCEVQVCGACTALVDDLPVSACTYLAYEARGRRVTTIEGIGDAERLHPIQKAFLDEFAFQCGFCTPGMILAAKALLHEKPEPTDAEVVSYMDGNLCRCTGYRPILKAIRLAAGLMRPQARSANAREAQARAKRKPGRAKPQEQGEASGEARSLKERERP